MRFPTVHLNGTSRNELLSNYMEAYRAINVAIEALRNTAPHGRDYYVQGDDAIRQAIAEYHERMIALDNVKQDMEEIAIAIQGD